jgi:hypothetical protein
MRMYPVLFTLLTAVRKWASFKSTRLCNVNKFLIKQNYSPAPMIFPRQVVQFRNLLVTSQSEFSANLHKIIRIIIIVLLKSANMK